ncbi:DUF4097 family beta strand repeat-containing protein [Streptomyces sp. RS10V-4]|uniref:DUF4097 family beta strand repeat-containing protein n=1 Tax=Streptomyces rhizoryzae TaxID=2932493 RepID=UPI0020038E0A|nr:DUF4097 family beta strand repeat-containing protein [Streptomyces rhizoryzae]MCK7623804.1 DUF4097 family beta strand repeat-containing protein [Streptomyces rhizoryzae]
MHRRVRFTGAAAVAGAGALALGACGLIPGETFSDDAAVTQKITAVRVDTANGGVTVRGGKGGATAGVHRQVTYRGDRPAGPTFRVEGGTLVLGGCGDDCAVNYTVELPGTVPVTGETTNGALDLSKVAAVHVTTSSGDVDLDEVSGAVEARTTNGGITGKHLAGHGIDVRTSNGAVELHATTPQDVRARTSNGAITVTVPDARYRVSAQTDNGGKRIAVHDDPAGRYRLELSTGNGEIQAGPGS